MIQLQLWFIIFYLTWRSSIGFSLSGLGRSVHRRRYRVVDCWSGTLGRQQNAVSRRHKSLEVSISSTPDSPQSLTSTTTTSNTTPTTTLGFIGTGTIASAIVRGIATQDTVPIDTIYVSSRSEAKSKVLVESFPTLVTVIPSGKDDGDNNNNNQEILDRADIIFLTVLPHQASSVLQQLTFDPERHHLVSLVSTAKLDDLIRDSKLDPPHVSKMLCLPSVSRHRGVCLHCTSSTSSKDNNDDVKKMDNNGDEDDGNNNNNKSSNHQHSHHNTHHHHLLTRLFRTMGGIVTMDDESDFEVAMVTTCIMGPLYGMMKQSRDWLTHNTCGRVDQRIASDMIIQQCVGAILDATTPTTTTDYYDDRTDDDDNDRQQRKQQRSDDDGDDGDGSKMEEEEEEKAGDAYRLEALLEEQTKGGLNEQALENIIKLGGLEGQWMVMDATLSRIRGESDGSIQTVKQ